MLQDISQNKSIPFSKLGIYRNRPLKEIKRNLMRNKNVSKNLLNDSRKRTDEDKIKEFQIMAIPTDTKNSPDNIFEQKEYELIINGNKILVSWSEFLRHAKILHEKLLKEPKYPPAKKENFLFIGTVGSGAFCQVILTKYLPNDTVYATKVVEKKRLVDTNHVIHALNEKLILQSINFVFTTNLEFFYHDFANLFYVLPFIAGGELFFYLSQCGRFPEDQARFYTAQIILALEYLHSLNIVYRDLKPENVLIDYMGFLKLTDFGYSKKIVDRTYTFCGTAEYLAPEIIKFQGYGKAVDWWCLGIFAYELCSGVTPFSDRLVDKVYSNIAKGGYKMPTIFSLELRDFIKNLLQIDLTKRYGNLKNGVNDIKLHKWFYKYNWGALVNRQLKAPYRPIITRPDDTRNFKFRKYKALAKLSQDRYESEFTNF